MCVTCGCGGGEAHIEGHDQRYAPRRRKSGAASQDGKAAPAHPAAAAFRNAPAPAATAAQGLDARHAPGVSHERALRLEQDILSDNDAQAQANRERFQQRGLFVLNFVSSPGSGKTSLLVDTIKRWAGRSSLAVVEGDQQTANDAERIRATGAPAVQINTGKGCHLDAHMVMQAADRLAAQQQLPQDGLLLIENVGNLVCPAAFDLGEAHKVVILSVTEGEDKPLKYPDMFRAADLLLISKADLLPHLDFDVALAVRYARQVRPDLPYIQLSSRNGEGCDAWLDWLASGLARAGAGAAEE